MVEHCNYSFTLEQEAKLTSSIIIVTYKVLLWHLFTRECHTLRARKPGLKRHLLVMSTSCRAIILATNKRPESKRSYDECSRNPKNVSATNKSNYYVKKCEHDYNENIIRENQKRRQYDYLPQQRILKKCWKPRKLDERMSGPYRVLQTHVNGTVTIELIPWVSEGLNIRRIILYKEWMQTLIS